MALSRSWLLIVGFLGGALAMAAVRRPTQDPLVVAPSHYSVRFENERIRVLEGTDLPGEKIPLHAHPDTLMVVMAPFQRRLTLENGKTVTVDMKAGDVRWMPAQSHAGENIGTTETRALFIEFKAPAKQP